MERLKYENLGTTIGIRLPQNEYKGFSVVARFKPVNENTHFSSDEKIDYSVNLWLKEYTVDDEFKIETQEIDTYTISATSKRIKLEIIKLIEQMLTNNEFNKFVERFTYTYKCFDIGNSLEEGEIIEK